MIWYSNGQLALPMYCGLKTGPVFEWLKTRWPILPFENQTQIVSRKWPFEYRTIQFLDGDCTCHFNLKPNQNPDLDARFTTGKKKMPVK
jgi:hypothetical protein